MDWMALIAIIFSLILIGFFAGVEIAFISVSKLSVELKKNKAVTAAKFGQVIWKSLQDLSAQL